MSQRIRDEEPDTSEATVRALLGTKCPQWSGLRVEYLDTSGTSHAMWLYAPMASGTSSSACPAARTPQHPSSVRQRF